MSAVRLELLINIGSDPIEGWVIADQEQPRSFCGWVELAAAIEVVHGGEGASPRLGVDLEND